MHIEIVESSKDEIELRTESVTIAEILRVYLNENGVDFAAWRREHPTKPIVFKIKSSKGVKKAVSEAVDAIKKDLDLVLKAAKK